MKGKRGENEEEAMKGEETGKEDKEGNEKRK